MTPLFFNDLFKIGIGPSSSHTVGPMLAGYDTAKFIQSEKIPVEKIEIYLYGSLAATGKGHSTDRAILLGLAGYTPDSVPGEIVDSILEQAQEQGKIQVAGQECPFSTENTFSFQAQIILPYHVNGMTLSIYTDNQVIERTYYSVGGGFVMRETFSSADPHPVPVSFPQSIPGGEEEEPSLSSVQVPYPYGSGAELIACCEANQIGISQLVKANELTQKTPTELTAAIQEIAAAMRSCVEAGCHSEGILPGSLRVKRRAKKIAQMLAERAKQHAKGDTWAACLDDPLRAMDWVNVWALAVNEENAAGHRVVTAPTNGAAGIIPAVLGYIEHFLPHLEEDYLERFFLAATAIGGLIKTNASIAGAEVGCQGEVGSAAAMAAAGLCEVFGGSPRQVENAAEIAMEHSLGLTCDPVGGLVQVPCIERNAMAAIHAIDAARISMWGDGDHRVSFDTVIQTMRETGLDMHAKYKETSMGGLAVNVVEC